MPASDDREEELRQIGVRCASVILARPPDWHPTARWLKTLPICQAVRDSSDPDHPALTDGRFLWWDEESPNRSFFVYDDEEDAARIQGPICRKLINGWDAAIYKFHSPTGYRFVSLTIDDAKRIVLLGALTLAADFDGEDLGLGWPWREPADSTSTFDGRRWSWAIITSRFGAQGSLVELLTKALEHLEALGQGQRHKGVARWIRDKTHEHWSVAIAIATLMVAMVGILFSVRGCTSQDVQDKAALSEQNDRVTHLLLEAEGLLDQAWDVLAGGEYLSFSFTLERKPESLEKANRLILRAEKLAPDLARTHLIRSYWYAASGMYNDALLSADKVVRLAPEMPDGYLARSLALQYKGEMASASIAAERAACCLPEKATTMVAVAFCWSHEGQEDLAVNALDRALILEPYNQSARIGKAIILHNRNRNDDALVEIEKAIGINPATALAHYTHGEILHSLGRGDRSKRAMAEAVRLDPQMRVPMAHVTLALLHWDEGDYVKAMSILDSVITSNPTVPEVHIARGMVLQSKNKHLEALGCYDDAVRLGPPDPQLQVARSDVLWELARYSDCLAALDLAILTDKRLAIAHHKRSQVLEHLGRIAEAVAASERAVAIDPQDARFQSHLSDLRMQVGR